MSHSEKNILIGVFANASCDLSYLDFSFVNLRAYEIENAEPNDFKDYIYSISPTTAEKDGRNWGRSNYEPYQNLIHPKYLKLQLVALVPINTNETVRESAIEIVEAVLLIMFPSDFKLYMLDSYIDVDGEGFIYNGSLDFSVTNNYRWDTNQNTVYTPLKVDIGKLKEINLFIKRAYYAIEGLKYLSVPVNSYVSSFKNPDMDMSFLSLCMALEGISSANTEISYRLARTCAVLCSSDKEGGRIIFSNLRKFYDIRSQIVHGSSPRPGTIQKYFFHLQALVSRILIELISLKDIFGSLKELNSWIDESGYGDKHKLPNYADQGINPYVSRLITIDVKSLPDI